MKDKLGLSFKNIRSLHKTLDTIPSRAKWDSAYISFSDTHKEKHLIQYRNPIDAIKSLFGNPAHANIMVYRPQKVFSSQDKGNRIYDEMWTGKWWNAIQVISFIYSCYVLSDDVQYFVDNTSIRSHSRATDNWH